MFKVPEQYRMKSWMISSDKGEGNCGAFEIPFRFYYGKHHLLEKTPPSMASGMDTHHSLFVIADDGLTTGWEHISASKDYMGNKSIPSWEDMCFLKDIFWDEEDVVMQLHPKKSEYINNVSWVLHLWRPIDKEIPTPPSILVGFKGLNDV